MEWTPLRSGDPLPHESLSKTATVVDRALAVHGYELDAAIDAIDDATPGYGGLFDPNTDRRELRDACETVIDAGPNPAGEQETHPEVILYVDGSARGNPGPAGAGAVVQIDGETRAAVGRPVGARADNNVAEYAALHLGLRAVRAYDPATLEVRIDSMTVIDAVWRDGSGESFAPYSDAVAELLSAIPAHRWTHLVDSDPNPADSRATVGADIAAIGPG